MADLIDFASRKKQTAPPREESSTLLTLDEAFRGVIVAWIHLHDTPLADKLFDYIVAGYNAGQYVIEVPESLWTPVQEDIYQTLASVREEVKALLQKRDT
jgi:hypothetical protein